MQNLNFKISGIPSALVYWCIWKRLVEGQGWTWVKRRIHAFINAINMEKVGRGARVDLGDKDGNTALALAKRWQWSSPRQYL